MPSTQRETRDAEGDSATGAAALQLDASVLEPVGEVNHVEQTVSKKIRRAERREPDEAQEPKVVVASHRVADEDAEMGELLNATIRLAVVGRTRRA